MSSDDEQSTNESLNEIIHPEGDSPNQSTFGSVIEDNESKSTTSNISASKILRDCFVCKKELQTRGIFNHIRKLHPYEFLCSLAKWKEEEMNAYLVSAEAYPFDYTMTNDFDEEETHTIYGCLACNNTFTNQLRANGHTTNKKCKANHIKGIKQMIKDEKDSKKKKKASTHSPAYYQKEIVLEMRRYKYILKCSTELNVMLDNHIKHLIGESEWEESHKIKYTVIPQSEYIVPTETDSDILVSTWRKWGSRTDKIETQFTRLRDFLFYNTAFPVESYWPKRDDRPKGLFIGPSQHDDLGPDAYPPLDTTDQSIVASVIPTA